MAIVLYLGRAFVDVGLELVAVPELLTVSETSSPTSDPNRPANSAAVELDGAFVEEVQHFTDPITYHFVLSSTLVAQHHDWSLDLARLSLPRRLQEWPDSSVGADGKASWALILRGLVRTRAQYNVETAATWPPPS